MEKAEEVRVDRRSFNGSVLAVAAGAVLPRPLQSPARVGTSQVKYLEACVTELWTRDWNVGGGALLRQAVQLFGHAREMFDEADYSELVGAQLLTAGANLGVCGSFIAFDAGDLALARRLSQEAGLLAESTHDPVLHAHAYVTMALQSTALARLSGRRGPAREAVRFLDQAADVARHEPSPKLHALIHMRRATAVALLDDSPAVTRAITSARRELDRGPHASDRPWFAFVTGTEITGHEARALADRASITGDRSHVEASAELYAKVLEDPTLLPRNHAFYSALLAAVRLQAGDIRGAVESGERALSALEGTVFSVRTLNTLRPVRAEVDDEEFAGRFDLLAKSLVVQ
ncbi:hypothetical protein [Actinomadura rudentiformis]|uniref:Transcriptional regulator n=1 Tax=Actinomadura rudentiformis TaxID=359158 RepID=A0A6H9YQL6_9ACTN|nr:hypothetical protein [Actinomadura rudentiformis]KAB2350204.1 hypothetical protein F8566_10460 [Actinomadura rudentiformis]